MGARAGKCKLGDRAGKYKLGARAGKYKLGAGGQDQGRGSSKGLGAGKHKHPPHVIIEINVTGWIWFIIIFFVITMVIARLGLTMEI